MHLQHTTKSSWKTDTHSWDKVLHALILSITLTFWGTCNISTNKRQYIEMLSAKQQSWIDKIVVDTYKVYLSDHMYNSLFPSHTIVHNTGADSIELSDFCIYFTYCCEAISSSISCFSDNLQNCNIKIASPKSFHIS